MKKVWLWLFVFFLCGLGAYFYLNKLGFTKKNSVLLMVDPAWTKEIEGVFNGSKVKFIIEVDRDLCVNRDWCGFDEFKGSFKDVANTVAYAVNVLNGTVKVNMIFDKRGGYVSLGRTDTKEMTFDSTAPIRFIFYNGDKHTFPINSDGFSRGWGVDPHTHGLVIFYGSESKQLSEYVHLGIFEALYLITNTKINYRVVNAERDLKMSTLWVNGEIDRLNQLPSVGGTLQVRITGNE